MTPAAPRRLPIVPLVAAAALIASGTLVAAKKRFWMDELFTRAVVTAPSFAECLARVAEPLESNPPLYFLAAYGWARVFGADEISLRILAALLMAAAFAATWRLLRPFGVRAAGLGAALAFGATPLVWEQNAEARPYGLFAVFAAAAAGATARVAVRPSFLRAAGAALCVAALVYTHVFGLAYAGALGLALLASLDGRGLRGRAAALLAVAAGAASFGGWLRPFLVDLETGRPRSWVPVPSSAALLEAFANGVPVALAAALLLAAGAFARGGAAADAASVSPAAPPQDDAAAALAAATRRILVLIGAAFVVVVPAAAFAWSRIGTSVFVDRYMIPAVVGWAILLAAVARRALPAGGPGISPRRAALAAALLVAGFLAAPLVAAWREPPRTTTGDLPAAAAPYADLPVAFEVGDWFLPAWHYHPKDRARFRYILDWEAALAPGNDLHPTVDYKLLSSLATVIPDLGVVQGREFLAAHPRFLIVGFSVRRWSELRVEADPAYRVRPLAPGLALAERVAAPDSR